MPRTVQDILDHADELAARFENYDPKPADERDPGSLLALRAAVQRRADAEREIVSAIDQARKQGLSWKAIGSIIGTSGEAARQRYGPKHAA
jgi:hypothetical protein